jgi:hypothetical protein
MTAKFPLLNSTAFFVAISCMLQPSALAQSYPVSGVWVAVDDHTPGSISGACFTLKSLGIDSVMDGFLPPVLIFADGKRIEARAGHHSEEFIKSIRSTEDVFRISEVPAKRSKWFSWSKRQSHSSRVVDPITLDFGDGKKSARFVKCSAHLL